MFVSRETLRVRSELLDGVTRRQAKCTKLLRKSYWIEAEDLVQGVQSAWRLLPAQKRLAVNKRLERKETSATVRFDNYRMTVGVD